MLFTLIVRRPFVAALAAAIAVDIILGTVLITAVESGEIIPEGVRFGFYKTNQKKG